MCLPRGWRIVVSGSPASSFPIWRHAEPPALKKAPTGPNVLMQTWKDVVRSLGGSDHLVIGGKSMGGRIASMVADEVGARGLVCLGYPFHAAGKPDKPRVAHLEVRKTPALIVQGTRDGMGKPEEVAGYKLSKSIDPPLDRRRRSQFQAAQEFWSVRIGSVGRGHQYRRCVHDRTQPRTLTGSQLMPGIRVGRISLYTRWVLIGVEY